MIQFFCGLDLGKANDHSAFCILEQELKLAEPQPISFRPITPSVIDNTYLLRHLKRWPLGTPYPVIVEETWRLMQAPFLYRYGQLIIDKTGIGDPVFDMFIAKNKANRDTRIGLIGVVITGGYSVVKVKDKREYHVPKADIVSSLALLFHSKRIEISGQLEEAKTLEKEMSDFDYKISKTGHTSYGAEGAGENDDLVLSVGIAAWYALRGKYNKATGPKHGATIDEKENDWSPI